jgi:hypothetical protein
MIRAAGLCVALALPMGAMAQEAVEPGVGAELRGLDRLTGEVVDFQLLNGQIADIGRLEIELGECRFPEGNPAGDAYAFLTIREFEAAEPLFSGWMIASSPALSALDHARYDVWVLRCKTS